MDNPNDIMKSTVSGADIEAVMTSQKAKMNARKEGSPNIRDIDAAENNKLNAIKNKLGPAGWAALMDEVNKIKNSKSNSKSKGGMPKKTAMRHGGMANGKKHMYAAGGSVSDNVKMNYGGLANKKLSHGGKKSKDYRGT